MHGNATALIFQRIALERLVDTLDDLEMAAWSDTELDRAELHASLSEAMGLATALLDAQRA